MRRTGLILLALALAAVWAAPAPAATTVNFANAPSGTHFTNGSSAPVCSVNETTNTVSCTGTSLQGVGNTNATSLLSVVGRADLVCHNPGNDDIVEPHSTTVTQSTSERLTPSKNGRLLVDPLSESITARDVTTAFTCPNPRWREEVVDISIQSFTYSVTFDGFSAPAILITGP